MTSILSPEEEILKEISDKRNEVSASYGKAVRDNKNSFRNGNVRATEQYIFPNQLEDASKIVEMFYENQSCRVISVQKKTKVGADGLMIQLATLLTTHSDDEFILDYENVRILTGMSNKGWETELKDKAPSCFKDKIFHHGQLQKSDLKNICNGLIIIDEIDTGDKTNQKLHTILKECDILNVDSMIKNNNRFVFISATFFKEFYDLYGWGEKHQLYKMTIPYEYASHKYLLDKKIIQQCYDVNSIEKAEKWIQEDIIDMYNTDYRIHIIRTNKKNVVKIQDACIKKGVKFMNHTSDDRIEDIADLFTRVLTNHIVICIKGFFRRADLIPNTWKIKIGAVHESDSTTKDYNVHIQGLPGRMTGYWKKVIEDGHKTGPIRTLIKAVEQYEKNYDDPLGSHSYQTAGFKKDANGVIKKQEETMLTPSNIPGLEISNEVLPITNGPKKIDMKYRIYSDESVTKNVCKKLGYRFVKINKKNITAEGFIETSLNKKKAVVCLENVIKEGLRSSFGIGKNGKLLERIYYPCYIDIMDKTTLRYVVLIKLSTDESLLMECDTEYPPIMI